jgi:voltage-gated potassium channel
MTATSPSSTVGQDHSEQLSLYDLFIGMLTVISLGIMAMQFLLPAGAPTQEVLFIMDGLFCAIFLADFAGRLWKAHPKMSYLKWQGITDFLGSIPAIPALRLFRLFRLARVGRVLRVGGPKRVIHEFTSRRAESALYVTVLLALLVIMFGSFSVYAFEARAPNANIKSGGDAAWWSLVTITTVGYGDRFPTSTGGRLVGIITMIFGIGLFGVFTSVLAANFLAPPKQEESETPATRGDVEQLMAELKRLHERLDRLDRE